MAKKVSREYEPITEKPGGEYTTWEAPLAGHDLVFEYAAGRLDRPAHVGGTSEGAPVFMPNHGALRIDLGKHYARNPQATLELRERLFTEIKALHEKGALPQDIKAGEANFSGESWEKAKPAANIVCLNVTPEAVEILRNMITGLNDELPPLTETPAETLANPPSVQEGRKPRARTSGE